MRRFIGLLVLAVALLGFAPGTASAADARASFSYAGTQGLGAGGQYPMSRSTAPRFQLIGNRCRRDCEWCRNDCYGRFRIYCSGDYCRPHFVKCMRHCWNTWCRWC